MKKGEDVVLVDVMNLAFRSQYALQQLSFEGVPTGLFFGFLQSVKRLKTFGETLVFCWDNGTPAQTRIRPWRKKLYQTYKASRQHSDTSTTVFEGLPDLYRMLRSLGYCNVGIPGLEADDLIALITNHRNYRKLDFLIHSTDSDLFQLLNPKVDILRDSRGSWDRVTQQQAELLLGFPIEQYSHYLTFGAGHNDVLELGAAEIRMAMEK